MQRQQNNRPTASFPLAKGGRDGARSRQRAMGFIPFVSGSSARDAQRYQGADAPRSPRFVPRCSFTLIEILIAVSIIAILLVITLQVVGALLTQGRDAATKATI